jgi:uncharacterized protein with HEPN domain
MSRHDDRMSLLQMLDGAREIVALTSGRTLQDLEDERLLQLSVLHLFVVLGEAARRVSTVRRDALPEIPWRQIIGMRDWLAHAYDRLEIETVWETTQQDLPHLVRTLERILR